jgi:hypothetical protein
MNVRLRTVVRGALVVGVLGAALAGLDAVATPKAHGLLIGPGGPFACPDLWAPVLCENGQVYSNFCYARLAGQTNCVPFGLD